MALTLTQLLTPKTEAEALADILAILDGFGFAASSWQEGSIQRHLVQVMARFTASASNTTLAITKGRFLDTAEGDWLALKAASDFNTTKVPAIAAKVKMTFTDPLGVGPATIVVSQLVATDSNGKTYRNIEGGTLPINGTLTLLFQAEVPGAESIPDANMQLATPIAGITAVRAAVDPIVLHGQAAESNERLRTRCRNKWATLAYAAPADAYEAWALEASPNVTRAWVDDLNPRGPGTLDLYVAGTTGAVATPVLTAVLDYIEGNTDGIFRRPLTANLQVKNTSNENVPVTGTLYVGPAYSLSSVRDAVYAAVKAYMQALPVGGTAKLAELYRTIMLVTGVTNVHLTAPTSDTTVTQTSVPVPALSLTPQVG